MKKRNWKKYIFEFLSIFIAVISAFALNSWNDNRKDNIAESRILTEILNGIEKDAEDIDININGHKEGVRSCKFWRSIINNENENLDTLTQYYLALTRDFTSIQNTSGYETLKSRGFELIENDSLRSQIISMYEFDYQTLKKLEEEYHELQFQENYFSEINEAIAPNFIFDTKGNIIDMVLPIKLNASHKNILLSYLWKIEINRKFVMYFYDQVKVRLNKLEIAIKNELNKPHI